MDANTKLKVRNRSSSMVVYTVDGIRRQFNPGEVRDITYGELERLTYQPGGPELLSHFLMIINPEATNELSIHREPEYDLTEPQIIELLTKGSLDQLLDCLDFAPVGVIDLVKKFAVELPINDVKKRDAIKEKTGFDVSKAIENNMPDPDEESEKIETPTRRVQPTTTTGRRVQTPTYKIVSEKTAENKAEDSKE